jgi:phosphate/sulfate permease
MGLEGLVVILFFAGLFVVLTIRDGISRKTGLKDGSKGLMFATIGFLILMFFVFLIGLFIFESVSTSPPFTE